MRSDMSVRHALSRLRPSRIGRDRRGAAAVEFAFIAPILILLVGGIWEVSMVMHARTYLTHTANDTARAVALGDMNADDADTYAQGRLAGLSAEGTSVEINVGENTVVVSTAITASALQSYLPFGVLSSDGLTATAELPRANTGG